MNHYQPRSAFSTPPAVKNLLILNFLIFLGMFINPAARNWFEAHLALYSLDTGMFRVWQLVSYMFLHGSWEHIFSNMFALWMFGRFIEMDMGTRRFTVYYFLTGIGAGLVQLLVYWLTGEPGVTVGASGAIFGILLAFGMLHPNDIIMLLIPPIPMKAKWFVIIYGLFELLVGVSGLWSEVAHFAHLGGMIFGFLVLRLWKRQGKIYY